MWKLREISDLQEIESKLLSLKGNVPSLLDMEVGINISNSPSAFDIVFSGYFKDSDALKEFEDDKFHKSVADWVTNHRETRHVVDYEVSE